MDILKALLLTAGLICAFFAISFIVPLTYVGYLKFKDWLENRKNKEKD